MTGGAIVVPRRGWNGSVGVWKKWINCGVVGGWGGCQVSGIRYQESGVRSQVSGVRGQGQVSGVAWVRTVVVGDGCACVEGGAGNGGCGVGGGGGEEAVLG